MMGKATSDITIIITLVAAIFIVFILISTFWNTAATQTKNIEISYTSIRADMALQEVMQGFQKTALFFGLMKTAKELGEHGGVSSDAVSKAASLKPVMYAEQDVPYLAVVRCSSAGKCETRKRMPFLFYDDLNRKIGSGKETITIVSAKKYSQNLEDVKNREYKLYAVFQIFMLKPGTVDLAVCQKANCEPTQVTKSDVVLVKVDDGVVANNADDITVTITGDKDDVAVLRQVAVSIYDSDVVKAPNRLLAESVNAYREKLAAIKPAGIALSPFEAAFLPARAGVYGALDANQGFAGGIVWAPDKISSGTADASASSFGIAEEDAKIRYWRMYAFADYFVDGLFISRLMNKMNEYAAGGAKYRDYYHMEKSDTKTADCISDPNTIRYYVSNPTQYCPDGTPAYSAQEVVNTFNDELNSLTTKLNEKYQSEGFKWKITPLGSVTTDNFEHHPNPNARAWTISAKSGGCCNWGPFDSCLGYYLFCSATYTHEYVLKNIKLLVEITDEKYKTFDAATNTWTNPTFKFFYDFYADDNYCWDTKTSTWKDCKTLGSGSAPPTPVEVKIPNLIEPTCEKTAGQTCEAECTGGKIRMLNEVCEAGKVCCK